MSSTLGTIEIQMLADLARLRKDMTDAKGVVGSAMDGIKRTVGAAMAGFTVAAFAGWIKGAINAADEVSKLAKSAGIATKDVAGLRLAFDLGGVGAETMGATMGRLSKQISDGATVFETLGIKTKNADGTLRSTKDVLYDTADAFQEMGASTLTTAKAVEIFGKKGAEMVPMLLDGSEGLREMAEMAEDLGLVIDEQTGAAAEQFNDTLDLLGSVSKGVANQLMAQMLPTLNDLAGSMLDTVRNGDLVSKTADGIGVAFKLLYSGVAVVIGGFTALGTYLGGLAAAAVQVSQGEFKQAWRTLNEGWKDAGSIVKTTAKTIEDAWTSSGRATVTQAVAVNNALNKNIRTTKDHESATKAATKAEKERADGVKEQIKAEAEQEKWRRQWFEEEAARDLKRAETFDEQQRAEIERHKSAQQMIADIKNETRMMSLSNDEREISIALLELEKMGIVAGTAAYEDYAEQLRAAIVDRNAVKASIDQTRTIADEWKTMTTQIGQGLTDSLFRAFESGKGFFKTLWDGIRNLFKTTVLQLLIKPVQSAITGAVGGLFGMPAAADTGGGMLGSLGSLAGLGSTLSTVAPYLAAAGALYAVFKNVNKSTPHMGSVVGMDADGLRTMMGDASGITNNLSAETDAALKLITAASVGTLNSLSSAFGLGDSFSGVAKFASDNNDASIGQYILGRNGEIAGTVGTATTLTGGGQYEFYSPDAAAAYEKFTTDVAAVTLQTLKDLDLPAWAKEQIDALTAGSTLADINRVAGEIAEAQAARDAENSVTGDSETLAAFEPIGRDEMLEALTLLRERVDAVTTAIDTLRNSAETGLAVVASNTHSTSKTLDGWSNGDSINVIVEGTVATQEVTP
jgi:hypothetical protein